MDNLLLHPGHENSLKEATEFGENGRATQRLRMLEKVNCVLEMLTITLLLT